MSVPEQHQDEVTVGKSFSEKAFIDIPDRLSQILRFNPSAFRKPQELPLYFDGDFSPRVEQLIHEFELRVKFVPRYKYNGKLIIDPYILFSADSVSERDQKSKARQRYRFWLFFLHPDKTGSLCSSQRKRAEEIVKILNEAWEFVNDKEGNKRDLLNTIKETEIARLDRARVLSVLTKLSSKSRSQYRIEYSYHNEKLTILDFYSLLNLPNNFSCFDGKIEETARIVDLNIRKPLESLLYSMKIYLASQSDPLIKDAVIGSIGAVISFLELTEVKDDGDFSELRVFEQARKHRTP